MSNESVPPVQVIRASGKTDASAKGEPTLHVSNTSIYVWIYNDKGSGAQKDGSFYRPVPSDPEYYILGDYAQGNYSEPSGSSVIVKAINDDPNSPLLKEPIHYNEVWNDKGSGGHYDGSIWYPVAPDGYIAIGFVCNGGYNEPWIPSYRCVRKDLVIDAQPGSLIWSDKGSGTDKDVSVYQIIGVTSAFVAQGNYDPYTGPCRKLAGSS
jgi:hypothetical protein